MKFAPALAALAAATLLGCGEPALAPAAVAPAIMTRLQLRDELRQVWVDQAFWTRMLSASALAELPDGSAATARLLENQSRLAHALTAFYGREKSEVLEE